MKKNLVTKEFYYLYVDMGNGETLCFDEYFHSYKDVYAEFVFLGGLQEGRGLHIGSFRCSERHFPVSEIMYVTYEMINNVKTKVCHFSTEDKKFWKKTAKGKPYAIYL